MRLTAKWKNKKFIIEEDLPDIGYYLYVFEGDRCIYDSLQDKLEICKRVAFEEYDVPFEEWS